VKIHLTIYVVFVFLFLSCMKNNSSVTPVPENPTEALLSKFNWYYDQNYDTSYFFIDTTKAPGWPVPPILSSMDPNNNQDPCVRNTFFSFQPNYSFVVKDCTGKTNFSGSWTLAQDSTLKIIPIRGMDWPPLVPNPSPDTVYWTLKQLDSSTLSLLTFGSLGWGNNDSAFIMLLLFRHD